MSVDLIWNVGRNWRRILEKEKQQKVRLSGGKEIHSDLDDTEKHGKSLYNNGFRELEKEDENKNRGMNCWSHIQPEMDFC
jgi:hypothetical protein